MSETRVDEIADGIYRIATYNGTMMMNQFLVTGDEPLLFHTGPRKMFDNVRNAVATVLAPESLRWIAFGHVEADECGSLDAWMETAPESTVAHSGLGVITQVNDLAPRTPRNLADGDVIDTGTHRLRYLRTPHVPHGWDAGLLFDETTGTLLCGDLFTHYGQTPALGGTEILEFAISSEDIGYPTALTPDTGPTIRRLAELAPTTLAIMHGAAFTGDGAPMLIGLAEAYEEQIGRAHV